jgi:hypothetical protein
MSESLSFARSESRPWTALAVARRRIEGRPVLDLVAPLTLILLLLYPVGPWALSVVLQLGAVAGLVYRPLQRVSGYWLLLAVGMGTGCILLWHDADNHKYLLTYWCLALGLSCGADDTATALRVNAQLLIGLCFLWAVGWKLWSPNFLTGEFFEYAMLTDDRLFGLAQLFTDLTPEVYEHNRAAIDRLTAYSSTLGQVSLNGPARVHLLARVLTAWTIVIEGAVAASFLWPIDSSAAAWARNGSLLAFALTTYFATPVSGFAWVLFIMGIAQVRPGRAAWRLAYLGGLAVVILYQLDLVDLLLQALH